MQRPALALPAVRRHQHMPPGSLRPCVHAQLTPSQPWCYAACRLRPTRALPLARTCCFAAFYRPCYNNNCSKPPGSKLHASTGAIENPLPWSKVARSGKPRPTKARPTTSANADFYLDLWNFQTGAPQCRCPTSEYVITFGPSLDEPLLLMGGLQPYYQ